MKDFMFKLDRCIWLALINQDKIFEAYESFNNYMTNLYKHKRNKEVQKEIEFTQKLFYTTLFEKNKIYLEKEDYSNALLTSNIMFNFDKFHVDAIKNYVKALAKTNQKDLCVDMLEYLHEITNNDKSLYKYYAEMFSLIKDYKNAIKYMEAYIYSKPENEVLANDYNWLGVYYSILYHKDYDMRFLDESLRFFHYAYDKDPNNKLYIMNMGIMYKVKRDLKSARKYWNEILSKFSLTNNDAWEYMTFCLEEGNFEEYFKYIDSRFYKSEKVFFPKLKGQKWDGKKDISNSTLLIYCIQGYGDTLLYSGYLDRIKKLAKKIIFVVQNSLYPLFINNNFGIKVLPIGDTNTNSLNFDYYIPSTDILKILEVNRNTLYVNTDFIKLNPKKVDKYKQLYFDNNKLKIGLSCFGSNVNSKERNLPLEELRVFDNINNAEFYILNKEFDNKYLPQNTKNKFVNLGKIFDNFEDTAIAIKNCDLIISTDNCILNLAGVLGKKTYGIFNWRPEFRWFDLTGEDVVWYKSVQPFVNEKMNDWENTIEKIVDVINNEKLYKKE